MNQVMADADRIYAKFQMEFCTGISASSLGVIAGLSKWGSPIQVWDRIVNRTPPEEPTEAMIRGTLLEPIIARMYEQRTGNKLVRSLPAGTEFPNATLKDHETGLIRHKKYPWFIMHLDGLIPNGNGYGAVFEAKSANQHTAHRWGEVETEQIPDEYLCQVQGYMGGLELPYTDVELMIVNDGFDLVEVPDNDIPILIGVDETRHYSVLRDEEFFDDLMRIGQDWWDRYVVKGVEPPPDSSSEYANYLDDKYPSHDDTVVEATAEHAELALKLADAMDRKSKASSDEDLIKNKLKKDMGQAGQMIGQGFSFTYRKIADTVGIHWERLARGELTPEQLAAVRDKYTTVLKRGGRRFTPHLKQLGES